MSEFALYISDVFQGIRIFDVQPVDIPHKSVRWYPYASVPRPPSTLTQDAVEQPPQIINGVCTQVWMMVNVSAEEAARRQQVANDVADAEAVKADAFVKSFIGMTPQQVTDYVNNNTANLAQTRALLNKMALMLLALARKEYR